MPIPALAALAMILAADPAPASSATAQACTAACCATLTGAVTARFECSVEAPYDDKRVMFVISPAGDVAGVKSILPARLELPFPLDGRSFTLATAQAGESRVELAGGQQFVATGAKGELTLEVDGLERYARPTRRYRVAGTLRARLIPVSPQGAGEVHLEVRF